MNPVAQTAQAKRTYDRVFGKRKPSPGRTRYVMRNGQLVPGVARKHDNNVMRSMAMGCPDEAEQARRLELYAAEGIEASYRPTGELQFAGGYHTQKRLARIHGLEVG